MLMNRLKDADILLFRSRPFPALSWFVSLYTFSKYSHVGLATKNGWVYEFKEFVGSRFIPISFYIRQGYVIDVYRCANEIYFDDQAFILTDQDRKNILETAENLIGRPYGWRNVIKIIQSYTPILRLATNKKKKDISDKTAVYVCSTLVSYAYRINFMDLCPFIADDYTSPGDISRSPLLQYKFTIV